MNAINECVVKNNEDENGNPTGGYVSGIGLSINWQNGPLGRHADSCEEGKPCKVLSGCTRKDPNGAFVETVISAVKQRLEYFQASKYECASNADAIIALQAALDVLESRTKNRENREVEGTHKV